VILAQVTAGEWFGPLLQAFIILGFGGVIGGWLVQRFKLGGDTAEQNRLDKFYPRKRELDDFRAAVTRELESYSKQLGVVQTQGELAVSQATGAAEQVRDLSRKMEAFHDSFTRDALGPIQRLQETIAAMDKTMATLDKTLHANSTLLNRFIDEQDRERDRRAQ
jgi:hypothetical protein